MIALFGAVVRARQYFSGRSLWVDEALVANDLAELSVFDSLTDRSPRSQLAPAGFWVVSHVADAISSAEWMLRLFPFFAGLALLAVAVVYAVRWIEHRLARALLVGVIALSPSLIYYSAEVKQYGVEALLGMVAVFAVAERASLSRLAAVLLAFVMLAFSLPALLIVPVLGVLWFVTETRRRGADPAVRYLAAPGAAIFTAWALAFAWAQLAKPSIMQGFWADAFAPFPTSVSGIEWWARNTVGLSHLTLSNLGVPLHVEDPAWLTAGARLVAVALWGLVGVGGWRAVTALRQARRTDRGVPSAVTKWFAVVPVTAVIGTSFAIAAMLEVYPFRGRLILVLVPLVAVAAAHGLDVLLSPRPSPGRVPQRLTESAAAAAAVVVALAAGLAAVTLLVDPTDRWDVEPAIEWIAANADPDDTVVAYCFGDQQLRYYERHLDDAGLTRDPCLTSLAVDPVIERAGDGRLWFLHGHIRDDADAVDVLAAHPAVTQAYRSDGVIALLVEPASTG